MLNVNAAESQLQTSKINLANQAADLERYKKLFAQHLISETEFNQFTMNFNVQKEAVESAENALLLLKTGATRNSGFVSNMIPRDHRWHGAGYAQQGGRVHCGDQHLSIGNHRRHPGRYERHDFRRPGG